MADRDQLAADLVTALDDNLVPYCCDDHPKVLEGALDADTVADRLLAAGWRPPARVIETVEQLDTLGYPCVIREVPHADEPMTDDFYPQMWEMGLQVGWCRAGAMFRVKDCTPALPVEVLVEPEVSTDA